VVSVQRENAAEEEMGVLACAFLGGGYEIAALDCLLYGHEAEKET
jgi:hypothetical protein